MGEEENELEGGVYGGENFLNHVRKNDFRLLRNADFDLLNNEVFILMNK